MVSQTIAFKMLTGITSVKIKSQNMGEIMLHHHSLYLKKTSMHTRWDNTIKILLMIKILLLRNGSNLVYCLNNNKIKYKEIAQIYNLSMSRGQISRFLFSSTTLVFLESTLWQETDLISLSAKWSCVQIVLNVRFKQIRIRCGVNRALMCLEIQISIPFPCMENRISDIQTRVQGSLLFVTYTIIQGIISSEM